MDYKLTVGLKTTRPFASQQDAYESLCRLRAWAEGIGLAVTHAQISASAPKKARPLTSACAQKDGR